MGAGVCVCELHRESACHDPKLRRLAPLAKAAGDVALPGPCDGIFFIYSHQYCAGLYAFPWTRVYPGTGSIDIRVRNVDRPRRSDIRIQIFVLAILRSGQIINDALVVVGCVGDDGLLRAAFSLSSQTARMVGNAPSVRIVARHGCGSPCLAWLDQASRNDVSLSPGLGAATALQNRMPVIRLAELRSIPPNDMHRSAVLRCDTCRRTEILYRGHVVRFQGIDGGD